MSDNQPEKTYFPKWMIRLNPYLRRADSNALLLYMKERSKRRWGLRQLFKQVFNRRLILVYIAVLLIALFVRGGIGLVGLVYLFNIALIINGVIHKFLIVQYFLKGTKPFQISGSVDAMVSIERGDFWTLEELWKCGTKGDEIQESLYFQRVWMIYFGYLILFLIGVVSPLFVLLVMAHPISSFLFLVSAYYCLLELFRSLVASGGISDRQRLVRLKLFEYGIMRFLPFDLKKRFSEFVVVILVVLGLALALVLLIFVSSFMGGFLGFVFQKDVVLCFLTLIFIVIGYHARRRRRRIWIQSVRAFEGSKKQMSFAVDTYIRAVLLKDPDWKVGIELELEEMQERRRKRK